MQSAPYVTSYLTEHCGDDAYGTLDGYRARGGYQTARRVLRQLSPREILASLREAGLQGRGGAGSLRGRRRPMLVLVRH